MKNLLHFLTPLILSVFADSCGQNQPIGVQSEVENEPIEKPKSKSLSENEQKVIRESWESSPDGIRFNAWKASSEGKKVLEGAARLQKLMRDSAKIEGVVTSLSLPLGSRLGFGVMVRMNGDDFILSFGSLKSKESWQLQSLKVNDRINFRSRSVSYAPKYAYPIVRGDYVKRNRAILFKRVSRKGGC